MTPDEMVAWKRALPYGPEDPARIAANIDPSHLPALVRARDEARTHVATANASGDIEQVMAAQPMQLKAQTLNEVIDEVRKKAPAPMTPTQSQEIIKGITVETGPEGQTLSVKGKVVANVQHVTSEQLQSVLNANGRSSASAAGMDGFWMPKQGDALGTIYINTDYHAANPEARLPVLTHEKTHMLDDAGLITADQMRQIADKYGKIIVQTPTGPMSIANEVRQRYADAGIKLSPDDLMREIFANIFQHWHETGTAPKTGWVRRAFDNILAFLNYVSRGFIGKPTAERQARDILAGKFQQTEAATSPAASVAKPVSFKDSGKKVADIIENTWHEPEDGGSWWIQLKDGWEVDGSTAVHERTKKIAMARVKDAIYTPTNEPQKIQAPTEAPAKPLDEGGKLGQASIAKNPQTAVEKRAKIVSDTESALDAASQKNKATFQENEPGEWSAYSQAKGNDRGATISFDEKSKNANGKFYVSDENGNSLSVEKTLDAAKQEASNYVEAGNTQEHYDLSSDARSEIINTLDLPPDFSIKEIQDTKWGSVYYHLQKKIGEDADGDPEYENYKVSIRNHGPSPFREKEFGANDAWYEIPKDASLQQISDAVAKVEQYAKRNSGAGLASVAKNPQTETPEFKAWFGDWQDPLAFSSKRPDGREPVSVVIGKNREPLVLYHATDADFSTFNSSKEGVTSFGILGTFPTKRHGFFATSNPEFAHDFIDGKDSAAAKNIMPLYMNLKNPMNLYDDYSRESAFDEIAAQGINKRWMENMRDQWELFDGEDGRKFVEAARKAGYDGAIIAESDKNRETQKSYVAFDPTQIKSATGNSGAFSPQNPDIRASVAKEPTSKRAQVGGVPRIGQVRPDESIGEVLERVRTDGFDSREKISDANTELAWKIYNSLVDPSVSGAEAQRIKNALGGSDMALGLLQAELRNYALKMAAGGNPSLFLALLNGSAQFQTLTGGSDTTAGRALRAAREFASSPAMQALEEAIVGEKDRAAASEMKIKLSNYDALKLALDGLNLTPEEVDALVEKNPELKAVEQEIESKSTPKRKRAKVEEAVAEESSTYAEKKLEELELKHSDVEWLKNPKQRGVVEQIIADALRGVSRDAAGNLIRLDQADPESELKVAPVEANRMAIAAEVSQKLVDAGVDKLTADNLAHEIESERINQFANKRESAMARAARSTSLKSLTESILSSSYRMRYDPKWRHETAVRWFESNGLSREQAEAAASLYFKEFYKAYMDAARKIVEKELQNAPPKTTDDVISAIHKGLLDPSFSWSDKFAELSGWKKPTREQFKALMDLDEKLADPALSPDEIKDIHNQMMSIVWQLGKREGQFARAMAERFIGSLLSGIHTITIQGAPLVMALRDLAIASVFDPKNARAFTTAMYRGFRNNLVATTKYAWQKNAYRFHLGELDLSHSQLERIWQETDRIYNNPASSPAKKAWAKTRQLYAVNKFVFKVLNTIDNTMMASLQPWKLAYYSSIAFKQAGLSVGETDKLVDAMGTGWRTAYDKAREDGVDDLTARVRANSQQAQVAREFVANVVDDNAASQVLSSAEKDIHSTTGRLSPGVKETDEGMLSRYGPNQLMQAIGNLQNDGGIQSIMSVAGFGFVKIPYRTLRYASNFSAYGLIRYGIDAWRKNHNKDALWKQSFANEYHAKARLREAIAGTVVTLLLAAWAASGHSSADDDAGDEAAALYVTGSGPQNKTLRDAWRKRGFRPYSLSFVIGGHIVSIPVTRIGEMIMFPFIPAAIQDDVAWANKEQKAKGKPLQNQVSLYGARTVSTALSMMGQAGMFQTLAQLSQTVQQGDSNVQAAAKVGASIVSAIALPLKGLLASMEDIAIGKLDKSSASAMIAANFPIVGLPWQHPAINRFGDAINDRSWYGIIADTGVPVAFQMTHSQSNEKLYTMMVEKGIAPPDLKRGTVEEKYGALTDQQFAQFAAKSGADLKADVLNNFSSLKNMSAEDAKKFMSHAASTADSNAAVAVGLTSQTPAAQASAVPAKSRQTLGPSRRSGLVSRKIRAFKPKLRKLARLHRTKIKAFSSKLRSIYGGKRSAFA